MFRNNSMFGKYNHSYQNQLPLIRTDSNQMNNNDLIKTQKIQSNQTIQESKIENKIEPKFENKQTISPIKETIQYENKFLDKNEFYDFINVKILKINF